LSDPYKALEIERSATADEVRKAYRRLAKKLHPDLNPGNKDSEALFKEVSNAYDLLSDAEKRRQFDAGEIDASGAPPPRGPFYKDYAGAGDHAYENHSAFTDFAGAEDIFNELFRRQSGQARHARGRNQTYRLTIEFLEAVNGAIKRVTMPDGGMLDVAIPPGFQAGQLLRLRGKGAPSAGEGEAGDALVEISVKPHPYFVRQGDDIHIELPITLSEAVLGARIRAPTPTGVVMLTVPKGSNTGAVLRMKGRGVVRQDGHGDELIKLKVVLPQVADAALEAFLDAWTPSPDYDPRRDMQ